MEIKVIIILTLNIIFLFYTRIVRIKLKEYHCNDLCDLSLLTRLLMIVMTTTISAQVNVCSRS